MAITLHPLLNSSIKKGSPNFTGGTLKCLCPQDKIEITIKSNVLHNHACGCSQCWKPKNALFSIVGVVPTESLKVTANKSKLHILDPKATILRHACKECGVHLYGPIEKDHAFKGLSFIHAELFDGEGWAEPGFAAFVPSLVENGVVDGGVGIARVREALGGLGLVGYDALNVGLMEALDAFAAAGKAGQ